MLACLRLVLAVAVTITQGSVMIDPRLAPQSSKRGKMGL
jgi:hypothetical protein